MTNIKENSSTETSTQESYPYYTENHETDHSKPAREEVSSIDSSLWEDQAFDSFGQKEDATVTDQLKSLQDSVRKNRNLTIDQRKEELDEIQKLLKEVDRNNNNSSLEKIEEKYELINQEISTYETQNNNIEQENKRTKEIKNTLANELDRAFTGATSTSSGMSGGTLDAILGTAVMAAAPADPLSEALTFGTVALIGNLTSETKRPQSDLKTLTQAGQNLDLIMHKQSGMAGSKAPGEIVRTLYDTQLSPKDQMQKIQNSLSNLPIPSRAYILSMVVNLIGANDPEKLKFLSKNSSDVLQLLVQGIESGRDAINSGSFTLGSGKKYKVTFKEGMYRIKNTDTSWLRNDWDNFSIGTTDLTAPMNDAVRKLKDFDLDAAIPQEGDKVE